MGALFDGYVAVDWSASTKRKTGEGSIWITIRGWRETTERENPATTRMGAVARIEALMRRATKAGRRLLCGLEQSLRSRG